MAELQVAMKDLLESSVATHVGWQPHQANQSTGFGLKGVTVWHALQAGLLVA